MNSFKWPHNLGTSNGANTPFRALHDICGTLLSVDGSPRLHRLARIFDLHSSTYSMYLTNERELPLSCLGDFVRRWNDGDRPRVELSLTLRVEGDSVPITAECCFNLDGIGDGWFRCGVCGRCERRFPNTGAEYSGHNAAAAWLDANGYNYGLHCWDDPVGIRKQPASVQVWTDIGRTDMESLDGRITWGGGDPRTADALVTLNQRPTTGVTQ